MSADEQDDRWRGLGASARERLVQRDYKKPPLAERLATTGVDAGEIIDADLGDGAIPGVELFRRKVFQQRDRGHFAELARGEEGRLSELGLWPKQWATARMFAGSAKGFHIHPPHIPEGEEPEAWFRQLFVENADCSLRPYASEQWDVMFFLQGMAELFLVDERAGMPRRQMRFVIFGDDLPGENNAAVVIPPGVAHAIRSASSTDLIMVYGTSTAFDPAAEGRIADTVEKKELPPEWLAYLG